MRERMRRTDMEKYIERFQGGRVIIGTIRLVHEMSIMLRFRAVVLNPYLPADSCANLQAFTESQFFLLSHNNKNLQHHTSNTLLKNTHRKL